MASSDRREMLVWMHVLYIRVFIVQGRKILHVCVPKLGTGTVCGAFPPANIYNDIFTHLRFSLGLLSQPFLQL